MADRNKTLRAQLGLSKQFILLINVKIIIPTF